jgi:hypothetical protein
VPGANLRDLANEQIPHAIAQADPQLAGARGFAAAAVAAAQAGR